MVKCNMTEQLKSFLRDSRNLELVETENFQQLLNRSKGLDEDGYITTELIKLLYDIGFDLTTLPQGDKERCLQDAIKPAISNSYVIFADPFDIEIVTSDNTVRSTIVYSLLISEKLYTLRTPVTYPLKYGATWDNLFNLVKSFIVRDIKEVM